MCTGAGHGTSLGSVLDVVYICFNSIAMLDTASDLIVLVAKWPRIGHKQVLYTKRSIHCKSGGYLPVNGGQLALVMAKVTTTNHCGQGTGWYTHVESLSLFPWLQRGPRGSGRVAAGDGGRRGDPGQLWPESLLHGLLEGPQRRRWTAPGV